MEDFFKSLDNKSIHIIGVTGAEGSNILRMLCKKNIFRITAHDFLQESSVEKSFKLWHRGLTKDQRENCYREFLSDLKKVKFYSKENYLKEIETADIIFVPQSWRLYPFQNRKLFQLDKTIPFYSLTRVYLDFSPATIIAVTGTVGKGSVANSIFQILNNLDKRVFFAGNETWCQQVADKLEEMSKNDYLVLEISHRQLLDGFNKSPHIVVITNIYPNHLDEVSWENYKLLKLSLLNKQQREDLAILNYDNLELREINQCIKSKIQYFSEKDKIMNTKNIQKYYYQILNIKNTQLSINNIAALSVIDSLHLNFLKALSIINNIRPLPARLEKIATIKGIEIFNDIKSTTPWATISAVNQIKNQKILICGGDTKGIDYQKFWSIIKNKVKFSILLKSQLSDLVKNELPKSKYLITDKLDKAINKALQKGEKGDVILISPAAAFFYSKYVKNKSSIKKIITSLLPKQQE